MVDQEDRRKGLDLPSVVLGVFVAVAPGAGNCSRFMARLSFDFASVFTPSITAVAFGFHERPLVRIGPGQSTAIETSAARPCRDDRSLRPLPSMSLPSPARGLPRASAANGRCSAGQKPSEQAGEKQRASLPHQTRRMKTGCRWAWVAGACRRKSKAMLPVL